jgi:Uma2 family endonuclease
VQVEAGIPRPDRDDICYVADLAVTCHPHERGARLVRDPVLIVEVSSPGTERHDRQTKVPAYREIESVQEILLIDSESAYAEIFRRQGAAWFIEILRGQEADLYLSSLELRLPMAELYERIELEPNMSS